MFIHNYLMFIREKNGPIKDGSQLVLLDIRGKTKSQFFDKQRIFKSEWFDIIDFMKKADKNNTNDDDQSEIKAKIKQIISMKYLFIIGEQCDFDNEVFRSFISLIMNLEGGKPFQLFLYKYNGDILQVEFPYMCLENETKKALSLYPNIVLKCIDIGA